MPPLNSCFCCNLLQGSIITGVYTSVVYLAAFIMQLSLVLEGEKWTNSGRERGPLPLPAYVLVVLHFTVVGLSVVMLYALYQKRVAVLLAWVFVFTLLFFPELGLVLFLVVFHWGLQSIYGLAEIVFYLVRAPVNVICILCVHSLHVVWKNEVSTERSLKKLTTLQMIKDSSGKTLSYKNAAFLGSTTDVAALHSLPVSTQGNGPKVAYGSNFGTMQNATARKLSASMTSLDMQQGHGLSRRYSAASHYSDYRAFYPRGKVPADSMAYYGVGYPSRWDAFYVQASDLADSRSEFNASLYPHHRLGSMPILSHSRSEQALFHPQRSYYGYGGYGVEPVMNHGMGRYPYNSSGCAQHCDYFDYGSLSRSLLDPEYCRSYEMHSDLTTQSLDRRRHLRRTQSFTSNPYAIDRRDLGHLQSVFYGYPRHQESKSSLGAESDDFRRYRDVAL